MPSKANVRMANRTALVNKCPGVFPPRYITKNWYDSQFVLSASGLANASYLFRGNSVYDPDYTSTGTSAYGYSDLANLYSRYLVTSARIDIQFICQSAPAAIVYAYAYYNNVTLSYTQAKGLPYFQEKTLAGGAGGPCTYTMTLYVKNSDIFGKNFATDADCGAATGSNPTLGWYFQIGAIAADFTNSISVPSLVRITYYTEWSFLRISSST